MVDIMICDDQEVVRIGLTTLLSQEPTFKVIGQASSAEEAVRKAIEYKPHVVIIDIMMPGDGIKACHQITRELKETKILVLTSHTEEDTLVIDAIMAGVSGYLLKKTPGHELVELIKKIHRGQHLLDPGITGRVFDYIRKPQTITPVHAQLSEQEEQILELLAEGMTNREIAQRIHLAERTVRNYVSNILQKLDLKNRVEAATYSIRRRYNQYSK